jgi:hypothetical protein
VNGVVLVGINNYVASDGDNMLHLTNVLISSLNHVPGLRGCQEHGAVLDSLLELGGINMQRFKDACSRSLRLAP